MTMAQNPYYIPPADPLSALMTGVQGYEGARKRATEDQIKAGRQNALQKLMSGDTQGAFAETLGVGDTQGASALSNYVNQQATQQHQTALLGETSRHHKATEGIAQANLDKPISMYPAQSLVGPKGNVLREGTGAAVDDATLDQMADQYMSGDTSVFTNLGRGAQGAENVIALRKKIAEKNVASGSGGADQAQRNAEYFGQKAGQRTLGTRTANMELAVNEAIKLAPLALSASEAVDRTQFPTLNKIQMAVQKGTGDENVVRLHSSLNALINVYARAINPTGVPTVSDKTHAREILEAAWSKGQFKAGVDQMMLEMKAARESPGEVKKQMRDEATGKKPAKNDKPEISQAREAIGKGAKREAVEKRLRERGIPFQSSDLDL